MKLSTSFKYASLALIGLTNASLMNFEILNQISSILAGDLENTIELLRRLSLENPTLETVDAKETIITIVQVTGKQFSSEVYEKLNITEADLPQLIEATPRFGVSDATLNTNSGDPSGILHGYGCWCRFGNNNAKGKGKAVDEIDTLCKQLHQSYECLRMDIFADDGKFCDPKNVEYDYDMINYIMLTNDVPAPTINENCQMKNLNDRCAAQTCELELTMLMEYSKGRMGASGFIAMNPNADFEHIAYGGAFSVADNCGFTGIAPGFLAVGAPSGSFDQNGDPKPTPSQADKECCGTFPKRYPFNTMGDVRQCCNGKTYNSDVFSCCQNSYVSMSCS